MKKQYVVFLIILFIIIFLGCGFLFFKKESLVIKYYRLNDQTQYTAPCLPMMDIFREALNNPGFTTYGECNLLMFETLNEIDKMMGSIQYPRDIKYIYGIRGSDYMASKSSLAIVFKYNNLEQYIPRSYVLNIDQDFNKLCAEYDSHKIYIMKSNIQRQEGFFIPNTLDEIKQNRDKYVVCQEMLQDPYLINERKINMRIYVLVVVNEEGKVSMYIFNNGFMYYTPENFEKYSKDPKKVITTGYIDRKVYDENPLEFTDLRKFLGDQKFDFLFGNILSLFKLFKKAYTPIIQRENMNIPGIKFSIFGADIAPNENLAVSLIEKNKGMCLDYKDDRDKNVKLTMVKSACSVVGLSTFKSDQFYFIKV